MLKKIKNQLPILIVSTIVLIYPVSVYASTQPDGGFEPNQIEVENPLEGIFSSYPTIFNRVESIFQQISLGNVEGAVDGILGAIGLLNPAYESVRISGGEEEDNPYANPEIPEEVQDLEQHTDIVRSEIPQKLSQVVFSPSGQSAMAEQSAQIQTIAETSAQAQQAATGVLISSAQIAQTSTTHAGSIQTLAQEAEGANASQDVLKALAAQNEDLAQIIAGNSTQLANLGEIATYQSLQLDGINGQLTALNGTGQVLQVLVASQNYLLSQVDDALGQQKEYEQYKDSLKDGLNRNMSQIVFVPGLFREGAVNE